MGFISSARLAALMIRRGQGFVLLKELKRRAFSNESVYLSRLNVKTPPGTVAAKIPANFRKIEEKEIARLFDVQEKGLSGEEVWDRIRRLKLYRAGIETCYAGLDPKGEICHVHWLIGPEENKKLREFSKGGFPSIQQDEMLMEGGYTPPNFRGLGLMSLGMSKIPEIGARPETRWIWCFVRADNTASLKATGKAGYRPHMVRHEKWRFFRRRIDYEPVPPEFPYPFERNAPQGVPVRMKPSPQRPS